MLTIADGACAKSDICDINLMPKNVSCQEKLERNEEDASYAETVRNRSSLESIARTENKERHNATELLQETEIDTMVIRELSNTMLPIHRNDLSNTQSGLPAKSPR